NARFLMAALDRELRRAGRFGQELSIVRIEAHAGESVGGERSVPDDSLLREIASLLATQVRSFDLLGRFEADEFMLIRPQTGREGAREMSERIRTAVALHAFSNVAVG